MKNFKNIILTGRAGSGKSELTHYLKSLSKEERIAKYHIGNFVELDDHPMLWNLGVTEDIWEQLGRKRQFTQNVGYAYNNAVPYDFFFKFLDLKLNRTIVEKYLSNPEFYDDNTLFIEFARGSSTGFRQTLNSLDVDILKETAIFFINNSYEESVRRNNARYEESKKNSILGHKVPDDFMENYYKINDWAEITEGKEYGYININGVQVPFITVWNEPETNDLRVTEERFAEPLKRLWGLNVYRNKIEEPKDIIKHFENMIIIGRPGSGKSEIVDLIKRAPLQKRMAYYYIGDFIEVDDFIWLNEKLKEDDFWEETGKSRKYSKKVVDGRVVTDPTLWDFTLEMLNKEVHEKYLSDHNFYDKFSLFIEFSRGGEITYKGSLETLGEEILSKSVILYLDISYEEALKRNELRYKAGQEDTKMHHKVPLEQMEINYKTNDWRSLTQGLDRGFVKIKNVDIPFVTLVNQPAPTSDAELERRVAGAFHTLFTLKYGEHPQSVLSIQKGGKKADDIGTFDHLFVFGRPAAGKSEFIDFVKKMPEQERAGLFHIGYIEELDDYKLLAEKFQEDDIWKKITGKAKYTKMEGNIHVISDLSLYNFAVNRINHLVITRYLYNPDFYDKNTLLVEFSRGGEIGYKDTLKLFDPSVLKKGAIIYIKASFEEAWRRNVARYEEKRKFSILAHMVPREQMERLYGQDDWDLITKGEENGFIEISGVKIPFVTMDNEKEAKDPKIMMERYRNALDKLISSYLESRKEKSSNARSHFHNLFVFGRPAGGKSEFIEFFKTCEPGKRRAKFKIAPFSIIDDYLSLREISENEEILEASNLPRKVTETTSDGIVVKDSTFFHFASEKINRIFDRDYGKKPDYYNNNTLLLEFSRGDGDSGYKRSLSGIKKEILKDAAIIYIDVSYEEALRRNEARYQEKLKHSVLAHKVPEKAMEKYYKNDDWKTLTLGKTNGFVEINGVKIPFVTMNNEPESKDPEILENRYETALKRVFDLWTNNG